MIMENEKITFSSDDYFVLQDENKSTTWLVPSAQKNAMEPIILHLAPGGASDEDDPHEGEEFGFVLSGKILISLGRVKKKCRKGDSFYFKPDKPHKIENAGKTEAVVLWISTPPSF